MTIQHFFLTLFLIFFLSSCETQDKTHMTEETHAKADSVVAEYKPEADKFAKKMAGMVSDDDKNVMMAADEQLKKTLPNPGLAVGTKAPNFTLLDPYDNEVDLYQQLKDGPVILVFYRGGWCPYCNIHLNVLKQSKAAFDQHNAQIIAVTPQKHEKTNEQLQKEGLPFPVVSDLDSSVMKAYRLYFTLEPELLEVYEKFNINLNEYNGEGRQALPVPGTFVIDQSGTIIAVSAETNYKTRMEPSAILDALEKI